MNPQHDDDKLKQILIRADQIQTKLDRSIFHLRTLYEVSKDIYSIIDSQRILDNFLLMTTGNFGVIDSFCALVDVSESRVINVVHRGYDKEKLGRALSGCLAWCSEEPLEEEVAFRDLEPLREQLALDLRGLFPFSVQKECFGFLGMGAKISGDEYCPDDLELLETLLFNLAGALKNALSFEEIHQLNTELRMNNQKLETTLRELRASLRRIEILESVKESLAKFVPATVTRLIEKFPKEQIFENKRQDISVLFLDIENYTLICNRIGSDAVSKVIESHFSVFMDAIFANGGDVNETAGDGLMVLFLSEDPQRNTVNAVRTALTIRDETLKIIDQCPVLYKPLSINIGINSGTALVGAAKFESLTGSRWTYTARGQVVNLAARIGAFASNGGIYLSKTSADRVKSQFSLRHIGRQQLKNLSEAFDIYAL